MRFLTEERRTLEQLLPGLDAALRGYDLTSLEEQGSPALKTFRAHHGPALLVPREHAGIGADVLQAVRVQRALGSRSPSLAVATTMHHFSIASLVATSRVSTGFEWMLLEGIARDGLLVASGFAEGRPGQAILSPGMTARPTEDGVVISGAKKPCSLARSMDLLTASVSVPRTDGEGTQLAVALVPADTPGMSVRPFWKSPVLAAAESDEVALDEVAVPADLLVRTEIGPDDTPDDLQTAGFLWFELLMAASYLGMASALAERVLAAGRTAASERAGIAVELEAAMGCVEGVARAMTLGLAGEAAFAAALVCRFAVQDAIARAVRRSVEALGGMAYISSPDVAYLASCTAALAFHPPSRARMSDPLCDYFAGQPLRVG
ncbi:acyl-CoA dehydrogenase family protein [Frankia sp. Cas3]|uniref:acyl-CoA dehydrogenase family protein n=1 Tax=Frankia sp. Cas3 TaxID=3073926 RepID=UPI002AD4F072|nr:acyl-CoA dehydrogenase family protein [Frankia sp. Cas3]